MRRLSYSVYYFRRGIEILSWHQIQRRYDIVGTILEAGDCQTTDQEAPFWLAKLAAYLASFSFVACPPAMSKGKRGFASKNSFSRAPMNSSKAPASSSLRIAAMVSSIVSVPLRGIHQSLLSLRCFFRSIVYPKIRSLGHSGALTTALRKAYSSHRSRLSHVGACRAYANGFGMPMSRGETETRLWESRGRSEHRPYDRKNADSSQAPTLRKGAKDGHPKNQWRVTSNERLDRMRVQDWAHFGALVRAGYRYVRLSLRG